MLALPQRAACALQLAFQQRLVGQQAVEHASHIVILGVLLKPAGQSFARVGDGLLGAGEAFGQVLDGPLEPVELAGAVVTPGVLERQRAGPLPKAAP
jgi:hypothetical protein